MSLSRSMVSLVALPLKLRRRHRPRRDPTDPRILVIRRHRLGDMIYLLPLLHALRRHYPHAHITVACDPPGAPIAAACAAVNEVIVLEPGRNPWKATLRNGARMQDYDWVIAAKAGFDRRLAMLTRLTNTAIRIGFERRTDRPSTYYTDPVPLPDEPNEEHEIETLLRLLRPLGLLKPTAYTVDLSLCLPDSAREFAAGILDRPPFDPSLRFALINLSSTVRLKFREEDFITLISRLLGMTELVIGLVADPTEQQIAREIAICMASHRLTAIATPGPLDLAALLEEAAFLITPEGGGAHLAAAVGTPALVLWSEGPFKKWPSRGTHHAFVRVEPGEKTLPVERVWQALQPFLGQKK